MQTNQLIAFMNDNRLFDELQSGFKADVMLIVMNYLSEASFLSVQMDFHTKKLMDATGCDWN